MLLAAGRVVDQQPLVVVVRPRAGTRTAGPRSGRFHLPSTGSPNRGLRRCGRVGQAVRVTGLCRRRPPACSYNGPGVWGISLSLAAAGRHATAKPPIPAPGHVDGIRIVGIEHHVGQRNAVNAVDGAGAGVTPTLTGLLCQVRPPVSRTPGRDEPPHHPRESAPVCREAGIPGPGRRGSNRPLPR